MRLPKEAMLKKKRDSGTKIYLRLEGRMRRMKLQRIQKGDGRPRRTHSFEAERRHYFKTQKSCSLQYYIYKIQEVVNAMQNGTSDK